MPKRQSARDDKPSPGRIDPTVIVALVGLVGTLVTALFASPVLIAWIQRTPTNTATGTASPLPATAPQGKPDCPYASETDTQTFINLKQAEEEAALTENIEVIKRIYSDQATVRDVSGDRSWSNATEAYRERFQKIDFIEIELSDLQVVKNTGTQAWVIVYDSGVMYFADTNERVVWQDGIAHLIFEKNMSGCWLISHFAIAAANEPFP